MSDEEWERWSRTWAAGGKPMPRVLRRAGSDRRRMFIGLAIFIVIAAFQVFGAARVVASDAPPIDKAGAALVAVVLTGLGIGTAVAMRDGFGRSGSGPLDLLADMERRHRGRRRLKRVLYAGTVLLCGGTIAGAAWRVVVLGAAGATMLPALASTALTVAVVWIVTRRVEKVITRELAEAEEVRRMLQEDG